MVQMLSQTETLTPADQAAVAEAVRSAGSKGMAVYTIGGGMMLDYGVKPERPGVGLSLAKLNHVVDYPADDLTITVEAGMTIAELNNVLAKHRQWLPVDVPQPERTTIGEAVAINAAGPRRYGYGTMRDYVLGFTAVDGTGMTFSGGGRVVKNAAGYNMCRLMAGSRGTLGVITQATLMVRPQSEASVLLACDVPSLEIAEKLLADLVRSPTRPVAIELLAGCQRGEMGTGSEQQRASLGQSGCREVPVPISPRENDPFFGPILEGHAGRLYVGFEGPAAEVDWMVGQLRNEWATAGIAPPSFAAADNSTKLWHWLAEFAADVQIGVLPSATTAVIGEVLKIEPQCTIQAHAGNGVIGLVLRLPLGEGCIAQLRAIATSAGGKMVVLRHPKGGELTPADIWGPPGPAANVMQAIKDRFDPGNVLNPGQFVLA